MKTTITTLLTAMCISGLLISAAAQPAAPPPGAAAPAAPDQPAAPPDATAPAAPDQPAAPPNPPPPPDATAAAAPADETATNETAAATAPAVPVSPVVGPPRRAEQAPGAVASLFTPPAEPVGTNQDDLTLSYNRAPLDQVLGYLSDAAGFIIAVDANLNLRNAYVTIKGSHMTKQEAVDLLNAELNRNNYAAVRDGRTLTIMTKEQARLGQIPVKKAKVWTDIPNNAEIATWIIPIRFVDAGQLVTELESFVSSDAIIVADPNGNSIIITDTQANIRHLAEIMRMVDDSAETETVVKRFILQYANPNDVATELANLFPSTTGSGGGGIQIGGGRGGRGGGGAFGFGGGGGGGTTSQRVQKAQQITVVPDTRLSAVVVSAPQDVMDHISDLMVSLDVKSDRDQQPYTYTLKNSDPTQVASVLQGMFGGSNSRNNNNPNSAITTRYNSTASGAGNATPTTSLNSSGTTR